MNHVQCLEHVSSRSASFRSRVNGRSALVPAVCMTLHWDDRHEYQKMQIDVVPRSHGHEYLVLLPSPSWTRCLTALLSRLVVEARFQHRYIPCLKDQLLSL